MRKIRAMLGFGAVGGLLLISACVGLAVSQPVASGSLRQIQLVTEFHPLKRTDPGQNRVGRLRFMGAVAIKSPDREFGGISGIIWEPECNRLLGVSDTGMWVAMQLAERKSRLVGVKTAWIAPILNMQGKTAKNKIAADAEELARDGNGDIWVFYEQQHRAERFRAISACRPETLTSKPVARRTFPITGNWKPNAGMEAASADGKTLIAISEQAPAADGGRQGFVASPSGTKPFTWVPPEGFDPTAMDLYRDSKGRVHMIVLHRRFSLLRGLAAVVSEAVVTWPPSGQIKPTDVAVLAPPYLVDNMEGLAIRKETGRIYLYLISDDNFNFLQKTVLFKFELLPASGKP